MFAFLNKYSIRARMMLAVALFITTLLLSMHAAHQSIQSNVIFAQKEQAGVKYLYPLFGMLHAIQKAHLNIAENNDSALQKHMGDFNSQLAALEKAHEETKETLELEEDVPASLNGEWQKVSSQLNGNDREGSVRQLGTIVAKLRGYIAQISDISNLILDPDLDSYYVMDAFSQVSPQNLERLAQISSEIYPVEGENTKNIKQAVFATMLSESDMARIKNDLQTAMKEDENFYGKSETLETTLTSSLEAFTSTQQELVTMLEKLSQNEFIANEDFSKVLSGASQSSYALAMSAMKEMDILLEARVDAYNLEDWINISIGIAGILISLGFYLVIAQSLITPLKSLTACMNELASGKTELDVPHREAQAEIGSIAAAVEVFRQNAITIETSKVQRKQDMARLSTSFQTRVQSIVGSVAAASTELSHTAELMSQSIAESSNNAQDAATSSQETYDNVQAVAAAAEEMSSTIKEISSQTQIVNTLISESTEKVRGADAFAGELQAASQQVRNVIQLISGISSQINLLALNATIESARAGEAGKGFAVVANEVRTLAGQTDKSIQDIEKVINNMLSASGGVITALSTIRESVEQIFTSSAGVASAVEEQSVVVNDIAQNMHVATSKTEAVKGYVTTVCELAGEADQNAQQVLLASKDLSQQAEQQAEQLESDMKSFLAEINEG